MSSIKRPGYDHLLKLIIIGDSSVGKTCILLRFSEDNFPTTHMPTIGKPKSFAFLTECALEQKLTLFIGIDFKIKSINVEGQVVKLQVWDTAGQERFRTITQTYYKGAMGIILVYDCTEEKSFSNISNWMKQIEQHASKDVAKVLVGNKADKEDKVIDTETGKQLADEYGLDFFETSAKTGLNIAELFDSIARTIIKDKKKTSTTAGSTREGTVTIGKGKEGGKKDKSVCC